MIKNNQNMAVALFLCSEKAIPDAPFSKYIAFLPAQNPVPLYFTVEEFQVRSALFPFPFPQKLRPSPCFEEALIFFRSIARQYCHFLLEIIKKMQYQLAPEVHFPFFLNNG